MRRDGVALRCAHKQGPVCGLVLVRTLRCAGGIFGDVHAAAENLRSNSFLRRELFFVQWQQPQSDTKGFTSFTASLAQISTSPLSMSMSL